MSPAARRPADERPRSQRGQPLAQRWWSQRFTTVLESYGLGARMERGRRYARGGRVAELIVKPGRLEARVQGSRAVPYRVSIRSAAPNKAQWRALEQAMAQRLGWSAQLLNGEVPQDLEQAFAEVGVPLFPRRWSDLRVRCGCPDDAEPCKHIAAVLYVFAEWLDEDPWLLLAWHGKEREALLAALRRDTPDAADSGLPPWWPVGLRANADATGTANAPGRAEGVASARDAISQAATSYGLMPDPLPPEPPERALQRLGPLELPGAPADLETRLAALYQQLVGAAAVEDEIALAETESESESEPKPGNRSASEAMQPRSRGRRGGQGGSGGLKRKASAGLSATDPAGAGDAAAQFNQLHT